MISRKLAVLSVLGLLWVGFTVYLDPQSRWVWLAIPLVLMLATIWTSHTLIDDWWLQRHPMDLPPQGVKMLEECYPYYRSLQEEDRTRFRQRLARSLQAREWMGMHIEDIPEDAKILSLAPSIILTLAQPDYMLEPYERIVLYKHPFISLNHPQLWHQAETEHEDGTLLFNLTALGEFQFSEQLSYDIALHSWILALLHKYPSLNQLHSPDWDILENISLLSRKHIEASLGLPQDDTRPIALHHYVRYPERFKKHASAIYKSFNGHFKLHDRD